MVDFNKLREESWVGMEVVTIICKCDCAFRARSKTNFQTGVTWTDIPCPKCGKRNDARRISYDPEVFGVTDE